MERVTTSDHKSDGKNAKRNAGRSASSSEMQGQSDIQASEGELTISDVVLYCAVALLPIGKPGYCFTSILLSYHPCRCLLIEIPPSAAHSQCAPMYDKLRTISCTTAHSD